MSAAFPPRRFFALACAVFALACTDSTGPDEAAVASVAVTVPRSSIRVGEKIQAAAIPVDAAGGVLTGREVTWASSDNDVASVSSGGLITALKPGAVTITATVEGKNGTTSVAVSLVPVATITVDPPSPTISAGTTTTLTATLKDSAGQVVTGRTVTWTTSNAQTASVTQGGVVSGMIVGTADITASIEGKTAKATVTVNTASTPVATITFTPSSTAMSGGAKKQLVWTLKDAFGNLITGRNVTFSSNNTSLATVSSSGEVTAAPSDGSVVITASIEGKSATIPIDVVTFVKMSAGQDFSCALTADGTPYCWGRNNVGQLGDGTTKDSSTPVKVAAGLKFVAISSGVSHSCAITATDIPYCWGDNIVKQLGAPGAQFSAVPVPVSGGYRFLSIAAGNGGSCGTTEDLKLYCWGGIGEITPSDPSGFRIRQEPVLVGSGMTAVVGGKWLSPFAFCSVDTDALAYCWPLQVRVDNSGAIISGPVQAPVSTSLRFTTVRLGQTHACGLVASGEAYCWGLNDTGALGNGTTTSSVTPVPVSGGLLFESLAAGGERTDVNGNTVFADYSCGVTLSHQAYCWGANYAGQLGIGSTSFQVLTPQPVAGGLTFTGLRAGGEQTCALAVSGAAYCWGSNEYGERGDPVTAGAVNTPTFVFGK